MKPVTKLFIASLVMGISLPLTAQNLDPPDVKNSSTVSSDDKYQSGASSSGSAGGSIQNFMDLGKECGMYLCEKWKPGEIILKDGTVLTERMIRYNIYHQQMEYAWEGDTSAIGNPNDLEKLLIENQTFVFRQFICKEKVRQGFLELLVEGKYELLLYRGIKYVHQENPSGSETGGPVNTYYQDNRYFLSCKGKIAEQLPQKKNAIIASMDDNEEELKQYVKDQKCKLKTQEELVNFFVFANTY